MRITNTVARSCHHCCSERAISGTHSKCVFVALGIQHAMHNAFSSVACPALPYIYTLSFKRQDFRKKIIENKIYILTFSTSFSEIFPILRRTERDVIKSAYCSSCKVPVIFVTF